MNEQIKELVEQATTEEHDGFRYFDKQKFAELIVKECAEVVYSRSGHAQPQDLLEHFGVEE